MRSRWTIFIIGVLSVFVILICVGQVFFAGKTGISTETAFMYTIVEEIPFEGVYMRDETPVYASGSGVLSYECENGSKVGRSSVIACRYRSENEIEYREEIKRITEQIAVLQRAEQLVGTDSSQLEAILSQLNEAHSSLIKGIEDGRYADAAQIENALLESLCKREITLGDSTGYSAKINELKDEVSRLQSMLSGDVTEITAGGSGYFMSNVDGYEGEITFDDISGMTAERIAAILDNPDKSSGGAIGKLISGYAWRMAAVINSENLFNVYTGSTVTLRVGSSSQLLDVKVVSITDCGDGKAVYVFECDRMNSEVATGRTANFKLIVNSYGGLRVARTAIRYNEAKERGVYIIQRSAIVFKKIDVIYWGEDYIICRKIEDKKDKDEEDDKEEEENKIKKEDYLAPYDKVVTGGKDLYEGKVV